MAIIEEVLKVLLSYMIELAWKLLKKAINSKICKFVIWTIKKFVLYGIISSITIGTLIIIHLSLSDRIMLRIEDCIWDAFTKGFLFDAMSQELANKIKYTAYYGAFSSLITAITMMISAYKNKYERLRELRADILIENAISKYELEREGVKTLMNLSKNVTIRLDANFEIVLVNNNFYKHIEELFDSVPTELSNIEGRSFIGVFYWLADLRSHILTSFIDMKCDRLENYHANLLDISIIYDILIEPSIYKDAVTCIYIYLIVKSINK